VVLRVAAKLACVDYNPHHRFSLLHSIYPIAHQLVVQFSVADPPLGMQSSCSVSFGIDCIREFEDVPGQCQWSDFSESPATRLLVKGIRQLSLRERTSSALSATMPPPRTAKS
jgi:hypothetical protein